MLTYPPCLYLQLSPRMSQERVSFLLSYAFGLGILATRAEPARSTCWALKSRLTKGAFKKSAPSGLCFGVASGIALGIGQLLYKWEIIYIVLGGYAIALFLTIFSDEVTVNVAWDSAGVTTGPVTVPFTLSLGLSLGSASGAVNGFGVLTSASLGPIISVLAFGLFARLHARVSARRAAAAMSRSLSTTSASEGEQSGIELASRA